MTKDNAQKQAIRARMAKTGERYTTARHYLLDLHRPEHVNADVDRSSSRRGVRFQRASSTCGRARTPRR